MTLIISIILWEEDYYIGWTLLQQYLEQVKTGLPGMVYASIRHGPAGLPES